MIHLFDDLYLGVVGDFPNMPNYSYSEYYISFKIDDKHKPYTMGEIGDDYTVIFTNRDGEDICVYNTIKEAIQAACKFKITKIIEKSNDKSLGFHNLKKEVDRYVQLVDSIADWI